MLNYRKGANELEEQTRANIPIECLPADFLWMHVNGGTKVANVVEHVRKALAAGQHRAVVWSGSGSGGVGKTISCVEIVKRDRPEMHQVTRLGYQKSKEFWEPLEPNLDRIQASREVPCINILQSLDPIDADTPGHQVGQTDFWEDSPETTRTAKKQRTKRRFPNK